MFFLGRKLFYYALHNNGNIFSKSVCSILKSLHGRSVKTQSCPSKQGTRVMVCGANGGIGQQLSLLLKLSPLVSQLTLYDINGIPGSAMDLADVNTDTFMRQYSSRAFLYEALEDQDIIVIVAGLAQQGNMLRSELFDRNASIVREIVDGMVRSSPDAMLCIVTNPVNSLVPVAARILNKACVYDPRKVFGFTCTDTMRASTFAAEMMCYDPAKLFVPCIGGHSEVTTVPVFSQASMPIKLPKEKLDLLINKVKMAGGEILKANEGKGTSTLGTAYSIAKFVFSLCRAIKGEENIIACAYIQSELTDADFFCSKLLLGPMGVKKDLGYGKLTKDECGYLMSAVKELVKEIKTGTDYFVNKQIRC